MTEVDLKNYRETLWGLVGDAGTLDAIECIIAALLDRERRATGERIATAAEVADEDREALANVLRCAIYEDAEGVDPDERADLPREVAGSVLASDWLAAHDAALTANAKAEAWDEARKAKPQYLGPDAGHYEDCMGYEDCHCASYPNPYREASS